MLKADDIRFSYGAEHVLEGVSMRVEPGRFMAILGNNGAGKSTLLKCINGILRPHRGTVLLDEFDVAHLSQREIARVVGYVPQRTEAARLTVYDAVLLGRRPHISWDASRHDHEIVERVLDELDLTDHALRYINELSGGELQKTALARALAQEPRVLLLDEPTASLDLRNQLDVLATVRRMMDEHDVAVVAVMHDLNLALRFADVFCFLNAGVVAACGSAEVVTPETIAKVYGVTVDITRVNGVPVVVPV